MVNLKDASEKIQHVFQRDSKEIYNVPLYQRPYSWGEEQIQQFCDDILDLKESSEYLLGSIILVRDRDNKNKFDIIDGQQRLTTISIFLSMFKFFVNDEIKSEIEGRLSSKNSDEKKIQRLKTHSELDLDFRNLLNINKTDFLKEMEINKTLKKNQYYSNAKYILDYLEKLNKENFDFNTFFDDIFLEIYLIRIVCDDMSFAMKTFEVLNNRGLSLKNSDLIKNELFSELNDYKEEGSSLNAKWLELENLIKSDEFKKREDIDDLFTIYIYSKLGKNPEKSIFDEFKFLFNKNYKSKKLNSLDFINDFSKFINNYVNLFKNKDNLKVRRKIYAMTYLRDNRFWKSIILSAYESNLDFKKIEKLINLLFNFYYLNLIGGISVNRHKGLSFNIIKEINEKKENFEIDELNLKFQQFQKEESVFELVNSKLNGDIYKKGWEKNIFLILENSFKEPEDDKIFKFNEKKIQIEHIFPQNPEERWSKIITEFPEILNMKDKLGNLTLLYGTKNQVCNNKIYEEKVKIYEGKVGNSFQITNILIRENHSYWNPSKIKERTNKILITLEKIFDLKEGTLFFIED